MRNRPFQKALSIAGLMSLALASTAQTQSAPEQQRSQVRDAYQGAWQIQPSADEQKAKTDGAVLDLLFESPNQSALSLDQFRAQRNAALSRNEGQLAPSDRAWMSQQAQVMNTVQPNSFDGKLANFYAEFPSPSAWSELDAAARLQPERLELIGPSLSQAVRNGGGETLHRAAKDMKARGEVAPALYSVADDMLLSVDRGGVLIVAGEMDGFPVLVRQYAEGKRPDALVIDHRLLGDAAYRAVAWKQAQASGTAPGSASAFVEQLHQRTARPVFLSLAVGRAVAAPFADQLHVTGLAMRITSKPCCTIAALQEAWSRMGKTTEAGPLSRNYLVPASTLLKHYRAVGDERRASELEHELRGLAKRLGATRELQANGILPH